MDFYLKFVSEELKFIVIHVFFFFWLLKGIHIILNSIARKRFKIFFILFYFLMFIWNASNVDSIIYI